MGKGRNCAWQSRPCRAAVPEPPDPPDPMGSARHYSNTWARKRPLGMDGLPQDFWARQHWNSGGTGTNPCRPYPGFRDKRFVPYCLNRRSGDLHPRSAYGSDAVVFGIANIGAGPPQSSNHLLRFNATFRQGNPGRSLLFFPCFVCHLTIDPRQFGLAHIM